MARQTLFFVALVACGGRIDAAPAADAALETGPAHDAGTTSPDANVVPDAAQAEDAGDSGVVELVSGIHPHRMALDTTNVYWSDDSPHALMMVPKSGGPATTLASYGVGLPFAVATGTTDVYWSMTMDPQGSSIRKMPLGGGAETVVLSGLQDVVNLVVDASHVYYDEIGGAGVVRADLDGSNATVIIPSPKGFWMNTLALSGTTLCWSSSNGFYGVIGCSNTDGSNPVTLVPQASMDSLATDGERLVYLDAGTLWSVDIQTQKATALVSWLSSSGMVAFDSTSVFFSTGEVTGLERVPLLGGAVVPLTKGYFDYAEEIALDATNVFWMSSANAIHTRSKL